jgi:BirA family biotin operon repressor/biotin-[acetyl-CoA-carboxylase] ligase
MDLARSRALVGTFEYLEETGSTNDELVERAVGPDADAWPDLSVLVTASQTTGRGRLGRIWVAPAGRSLAISILVRPRLPDGGPLPVDRLGWLPLLTGAAMTRAVRAVVRPFADDLARAAAEDGTPGSIDVDLKWPNDVLISGYKVSGILAELLPAAAASDLPGVVIGAGVNLSFDEHDLPTPTSTSLLLVTGSAPDPDTVLSAYLEAFIELYRGFVDAGGDPVASGLRDEVLALCGTIGREVRVELPGGETVVGTAVGIDADGRLVVEDRENGEPLIVAAGDVTHLRY